MNRPTRSYRPNVWRLLNAAGPVFGLLLVIGLFSLSPAVRSHFFTGINCKIILLQTVIVAIGALGMTMIIVSGGIDLSVGSGVALSGVAPTTPDRATTEPTLKSMPPLTIIMVIPSAPMATITVCKRMILQLSPVKKCERT